MNRREFLHIVSMMGLTGLVGSRTTRYANLFSGSGAQQDYRNIHRSIDARLVHFTDTNAQLLPYYYREPSDSIPYTSAAGEILWQPGSAALERFGLSARSPLGYMLSSDNYYENHITFGKIGGYSYLSSLILQLREEVGAGNSLLLDGGNSWQGSARQFEKSI